MWKAPRELSHLGIMPFSLHNNTNSALAAAAASDRSTTPASFLVQGCTQLVFTHVVIISHYWTWEEG